MTATLEAPVVETISSEQADKDKRNKEIAEFVMPRPNLGQAVTWFPSGTRTNGEMAYVLTIGRRNLVVQRASGIAMDSVRHVDDPKLSLSVEQRASGAWDFTERDKQLDKLQATVELLQARVVTLEEFINEPAKKKDK